MHIKYCQLGLIARTSEMRYIVNCANKPIKTLTGLHGINVFLFDDYYFFVRSQEKELIPMFFFSKYKDKRFMICLMEVNQSFKEFFKGQS